MVVTGARPGWIADAARRLRDGTVTSMELTGDALAGIDRVDARLRSFRIVDRHGALEAARRADTLLASGRDAGPLTGIPVGIKDIIDMAGLATRCGSPAYPDRPRDRDATVVARLREAGAVLIGKTITHELACGVYSPPAANPWDVDRLPGGSSGGSGAAVAAGVVPMALGSDTGGSIRIPASVCGIAGLKPTFGRVSRAGVEALAWSLDHIGPLAATVADCAASLQVLAGYDPADPSTSRRPVPDFGASLGKGVEGLRMGVLESGPFSPLQEGVGAAFGEAIEVLHSLGAELSRVHVPELEHTLATEFAIVGPEAASYHRRLLRERPERISPGIRELFASGTIVPASHYLAGLRARLAIRHGLRTAFEKHRLDVVVSPTLPATAALADRQEFEVGGIMEDVTSAYVRTTAPFNLSGQPALSVPCGYDTRGLPVGLQIAGRPFDEATVLRVGAAYEAVTPWVEHCPPIHVDGAP